MLQHQARYSSSAVEQCDVLIIGGGVGGTSVGYEVAQKGDLKVVILEQEEYPGYHSTGRAAGLFAENYGTPSVKQLTMASRDWFLNPPSECNPDIAANPILTPSGLLCTASREAQDAMMEHFYADSPCHDIQIIDRQRARSLCPFLRYDDHDLVGDRFVFEPGATALDIGNVHSSYLRGCKQRGVTIECDQQVDSLERGPGGSHWEITTNLERGAESKRYEARSVINAAGPWSDEIASKAGFGTMGIQPLRRCLVVFGPHSDAIQQCLDGHISADSDYVLPWVFGVDEEGKEFWYIGPQGKSGLFVCSPANRDPDEAGDAMATDLEIAICIDRIETFTQCEVKKVHSKWAGLRCYSPDGDFVIGPDPGDESASFFWCSALAGQGIQAAPGYSRLLAAMVRGEAMPESLQQFGFEPMSISPQRFVAEQKSNAE